MNVERNITKKKIYKRKNKVFTEAIVQRFSVKKVFLEISQNLQKNIFARVSFFNFAKFLRAPFLTEHLWWLLLGFIK